MTEEEFNKLKYPSFIHYVSTKYQTSKLIIAYDNSQRLRSVDTSDVESVFKSDGEVEEHKLEAQLRILNGNDYKFANNFANLFVDFIKQLLSIKSDLSAINFDSIKQENIKYNYFRLAENLEEWFEYIRDKQMRFKEKKSVLLAGYCRTTRKDKKEGKKIFLTLGNQDIQWNTNGEVFRDYKTQELTIGSVYDIHGFDIDFAAVYVGKDIRLSDGNIIVDKNEFYDVGAKRGTEDVTEFVKNAYYILLTRAIYGQIIYIEDDNLRNFLIDRLT